MKTIIFFGIVIFILLLSLLFISIFVAFLIYFNSKTINNKIVKLEPEIFLENLKTIIKNNEPISVRKVKERFIDISGEDIAYKVCIETLMFKHDDYVPKGNIYKLLVSIKNDLEDLKDNLNEENTILIEFIDKLLQNIKEEIQPQPQKTLFQMFFELIRNIFKQNSPTNLQKVYVKNNQG